MQSRYNVTCIEHITSDLDFVSYFSSPCPQISAAPHPSESCLTAMSRFGHFPSTSGVFRTLQEVSARPSPICFICLHIRCISAESSAFVTYAVPARELGIGTDIMSPDTYRATLPGKVSFPSFSDSIPYAQFFRVPRECTSHLYVGRIARGVS